MAATLLIFSALATDVPPNFKTCMNNGFNFIKRFHG
jgi:hypothetical protein